MSERNQGANQQGANQGGSQQAGGQPAGAGGGRGGRAPGGAQQYGHRGGGGTDLVEPAKLGIGAFALVGFGVAVTLFLLVALMPGSGGGLGTMSPLGLLGGAGGGLFGALLLGMVLVIFAGPVVATGVGAFLGYTADAGESGPLQGGAASAIGAAVTVILMLVLALVLAPSGGPGGGAGSDLGAILGPLLGAVIGIALTGAGAGLVGENVS